MKLSREDQQFLRVAKIDPPDSIEAPYVAAPIAEDWPTLMTDAQAVRFVNDIFSVDDQNEITIQDYFDSELERKDLYVDVVELRRVNAELRVHIDRSENRNDSLRISLFLSILGTFIILVALGLHMWRTA